MCEKYKNIITCIQNSNKTFEIFKLLFLKRSIYLHTKSGPLEKGLK